MNENTWSYFAKDLDNQENASGFVQVFRREDAARTYYAKGIDGEGSSVYHVFAESWTRKGAAQKALACILLGGQKKGEILDSYVYEEGNRDGRTEDDDGD